MKEYKASKSDLLHYIMDHNIPVHLERGYRFFGKGGWEMLVPDEGSDWKDFAGKAKDGTDVVYKGNYDYLLSVCTMYVAIRIYEPDALKNKR